MPGLVETKTIKSRGQGQRI